MEFIFYLALIKDIGCHLFIVFMVNHNFPLFFYFYFYCSYSFVSIVVLSQIFQIEFDNLI